MVLTSLALGPLGATEGILVAVASSLRMAKGQLGHPIRRRMLARRPAKRHVKRLQ